MDDERARHQRLMDLFDEACDLSPDAQRAFVDALRGTADEALLGDLDEMLELDRGEAERGHEAGAAASRGLVSGHFGALAERAMCDFAGDAPPSTDSFVPGVLLERYRLLGELGRGGMSVVYAAEQVFPRRRVALKILRQRHSGSVRLRKRLALEAGALARLEHPAIVRLYEVVPDDEQLGLVLELVEDARPLTTWAAERALSVPARLALLAAVCEAVDHAHEQGVVHRDLKPSNVVVDRRGQVRVLDFGVARLLEHSGLTPTTHLTLEGELVGTPAYMAPEQLSAAARTATGAPARIDARADVYALGVLGFELLTGELPWDVRPGHLLGEVLLMLRDTRPRRAGSLDRRLRGDLELVLARAMAPVPAERYPSAAFLADDLRAILAHRPVRARPATLRYVLGRFARRHRTPLLALTAAAAVALAALAIAPAPETTPTTAPAAAAPGAPARPVSEPTAALAQAALWLGRDPTRSLLLLRDVSDADAEAAWWLARQAIARGVARDLYDDLGSPLRTVAVSPDGQRIAVGGDDHTVELLELDAHTVRTVAGFGAPLAHLAFGAGGELAALDRAGRLRLVPAHGIAARPLEPDRPAHSARWSADGTRLLAVGHDGTLRIWNTRGALLESVEATPLPPVVAAALADDGRLALAHAGGSLRVRAPDGRWTAHAGDNSLIGLEFSGTDGVVGVTSDGRVVLHTLSTATRLALHDLDGGLAALARSPDGALVLASRTGQLALWHDGALEPLALDVPPCGAGAAPGALALDRAAGRLAAGCPDGRIALYRRGASDGAWHHHGARLGHRGAVAQLVDGVGRAGDTLVSISSDGTLRLWPATDDDGPEQRLVAVPAAAPLREVVVARAGDALLGVAHDGTVWRRSLVHPAEAPQRVDLGAGALVALRELPGGELLGAASSGEVVRASAAGTPLRRWGLPGPPLALLVSADGRWLAAHTAHGHALVWSSDDDALPQPLRLPDGLTFTALAFAGDPTRGGTRLLSGDSAGTVREHRLETADTAPRVVGTLPDAVSALAADATQVVAAGGGRVRLWSLDAGEGARVREPAEAVGAVTWLGLSGEGVVLCGAGDSPRLWWPRRDAMVPLRGHEAPLVACTLAGEGTLLSAAADGEVRAWAVDEPRPRSHPVALARGALRALVPAGAARAVLVLDAAPGVALWPLVAPEAPGPATEALASSSQALQRGPGGAPLATWRPASP